MRTFQGLRGHDPSACEALAEFVDDERERLDGGAVEPCITGDLTAFGHRDQFSLARRFLGGRTEIGGVGGVGLALNGWGLRTVPGNHDHWSGLPMPVGPGRGADRSRGFKRTFDDLPRPSSLVELGGGWSMRLLRIDTDIEVGHGSRLVARGSCADSVAELRRRLSGPQFAKGAREARALLLHTPYSLDRGLRYRLDSDSRAQIEGLVRDHGVDVLLSGHIHDPFVAVCDCGGRSVLEARSGTCLQRVAATGQHAPEDRPPENTFLVHTLTPQEESLVWTVELYRHSLGVYVPDDRFNVPPHTISSGGAS